MIEHPEPVTVPEKAGGGRRMSARPFLIVALVAALVVPPAAAWYLRPKKFTLTLDATGRAGISLKGTAEVDGRTEKLSGTVPAQFVLEGHRITYTLEEPEDKGEVRVRASVGGTAIGSTGTGQPPTRGIRGWVKSGWAGSELTYWIESYERKGNPPWRTPPP
jgi:hypothetical protein